MARVMVAAVFFVLVVSLGASAVDFESESIGKRYVIDNEVNDPQGGGFAAGEVVNLTNSNVDDAVYPNNQFIEIRGENGIIKVEGEDYTWNQHNGTITILAGGDLEGDSNLTADYQFRVPTEQQREIADIVGNELSLATALVYALGAIIGVSILRLLVGAAP